MFALFSSIIQIAAAPEGNAALPPPNAEVCGGIQKATICVPDYLLRVSDFGWNPPDTLPVSTFGATECVKVLGNAISPLRLIFVIPT